MFQHDARHSGQTTVAGPSAASGVRPKWIHQGTGWFKPQPAVGPDVLQPDGSRRTTIYVGRAKKPLCALDGETGDEKWCISGDNANSSSPAIGESHSPYDAFDHTIYVGARDNKLWAVYPDGTPTPGSYKILKDGDIKSSTVIGLDGTTYTACGCLSSGLLHAINPDGTLKWMINLKGNIANIGPAIGDNGRIYMATADKLHAIDDAGTLLWSLKLPGKVRNSSPSVYTDATGTYIYIGSVAGISKIKDTWAGTGVCPLGATCGAIVGYMDTDGEVTTTPAITSSGLVLFSAWKPRTRTLYALDLNLNTYTRPCGGTSCPWLPKSGLDRREPVDSQTPSVVVDTTGVFYAAIGVQIYAFDPRDPSGPAWKTIWQYELPDEVLNMSLGAGVLYVSAHDFAIYALESDL
jgi:hypothetical protein